MRIIKEITHPQFKITLFSWNEKFLIKIEAGPYEQVYKIRQTDLNNEADIDVLLNTDFLKNVEETFRKMHNDFKAALSS